MEAVGFALEDKTINVAAASDATGTPLIGRPVINALTGQEAVTLDIHRYICSAWFGVRCGSRKTYR